MPDKPKQCRRCKSKDNGFYARTTAKDGLETLCKACKRKDNRKHARLSATRKRRRDRLEARRCEDMRAIVAARIAAAHVEKEERCGRKIPRDVLVAILPA